MYFNRLYFFLVVLGLEPNWKESTGSPCLPHTAVPTVSAAHHSGVLVIIDEPTATHPISHGTYCTLGFTLSVVHSIGFEWYHTL